MERSSGAAPPRRSGVVARDKPTDGDLLTIEVERLRDGVSLVALAGELDLSTIPQLEGRIFEELHERESVCVDLTRLTFIDSSGIGLLIKAHRETDNGEALHIVVSEGSQIERVFALAGIGKALPVFLDCDQAIASLEDGRANSGRHSS